MSAPKRPRPRPRAPLTAFLPPLALRPAPPFSANATTLALSPCHRPSRVVPPPLPASPDAPTARRARLTPALSIAPPAPSRLPAPPPADPPAAAPRPDQPKKARAKRVVTEETRRKIAYAMLGQRKSDDMRAKVSRKLKGRVPWNKGKKMSPETRARMSEARFGRTPWNKGVPLSQGHRQAISRSATASGRKVSAATRRRLRMARRRPGDAIVQGSQHGNHHGVGSYPLVDSADINEFVYLRRELRVWSDSYKERNSRRPSLAEVRRIAPPGVVCKFERYARMRDKIRGLASDVYGAVNPKEVPVIPAGDSANAPRNNNSQTVIRVTKHGNSRLVNAITAQHADSAKHLVDGERLNSAIGDMFDEYDRPTSPGKPSADVETHNSLIGVHELSRTRKDQLSANDYRMIGKYRLMESIDINRFMSLRKELQSWSAAFKEENGRTPALSDAQGSGSTLHRRFCEYLDMRDRISGLVREVYGTEMDDMDTFQKVNTEGKEILDTLRGGVSQSSVSVSQVGETVVVS